jgi:predicted PurR-regulated permease PerM
MSSRADPGPVRAWPSRTQVRALALAAGTLLVLYLCYRVAQPFLIPLVWGATLALVVFPVHRWLAARTHRPGLAAATSVVLVTVLLVVPAAWAGTLLVREGRKGASALQEAWHQGRGQAAVAKVPGLSAVVRGLMGEPGHAAEPENGNEPRPEADGKSEKKPPDPGAMAGMESAAAREGLGPALKSRMPRVLSGTVKSVVEVLVALFALFFFLRDGERAVAALRGWVPLTRAESRRVLRRLGDTVKATTFGTVTVGAIQGFLGGLMFWWLGLPGPVLWGAVMALLAIVPVLGAFIVWVPAALFLAVEGEPLKALILAAWGALVIGLADNLLYPVLVGRQLRMHTLPVFIAIIGGLSLFGAVGLVIGPAVLCLAVELLRVWKNRLRGPRPAPEV